MKTPLQLCSLQSYCYFITMTYIAFIIVLNHLAVFLVYKCIYILNQEETENIFRNKRQKIKFLTPKSALSPQERTVPGTEGPLIARKILN